MLPSLDEVFRGQDQGPGAGRSVSAADVVLYGVNIVLPLMSQDLLKVSIQPYLSVHMGIGLSGTDQCFSFSN